MQHLHRHSRSNCGKAVVTNNRRSSRSRTRPRIQEKKRFRFIYRTWLRPGDCKEIVCSLEGCVPSPDAGAALHAAAAPVAYGFLDFCIRTFDFRNGLAQLQGGTNGCSIFEVVDLQNKSKRWANCMWERRQRGNAGQNRETGDQRVWNHAADPGSGIEKSEEFTMPRKLGVRMPDPTEDQIHYIFTGGEVIVGAKHSWQRGISVCYAHRTLIHSIVHSPAACGFLNVSHQDNTSAGELDISRILSIVDLRNKQGAPG
ncbi:hypothetical protein B0H10DRAFT_1966964 [Mycena sp. CBHHK59/15]|nr:hypothetical protein B0H10DRAFT_1966964 [Mycena sp. CBHHK59/15]